MTKNPAPTFAENDVDATQDQCPQSQANQNGPAQPASVLALASAANAATQRGSSRKSASSGSHSHRRSQTIVVAGNLEMEHIQKHKAVEELHTELESKCKALEESQEEAQLAARIGQTLLQRNQEMGVEIESKAIELQNRAETAEQVMRVLEQKLSSAIAQIRSLDIARTRATLEAEQLAQELEDCRAQVHALKGDCTRANQAVQREQMKNARLEEELETARNLIVKTETAKRQLQTDLSAKKERIEVLESVERYNVEHISRLEIENQSICQQHHVLAHREMQLQVENDALNSKMTTMANIMKETQAKSQEVEHKIQGLYDDIEDLREALHAEQTRVIQLTKINQELEARLDRNCRLDDHDHGEEGPSAGMLRNGSLFFELSRQIREEMHEAKAQRAKERKVAASPEDASPTQPGLESPCRSSTRTSRNPSSNNTDSVEETDDSTADYNMNPRRPPPLQLERRRSQQEEVDEIRAAIVTAKSPRAVLRGSEEDDEDDHESLLKEFFVLTAAAVKIAGGGLRNDACNIHNEDLYAEAMAHNVTFDQFHHWLERRLEGELEISLSPMHAVAYKKPASPVAATPSRGMGIINFWSRQ